MHNFKHERDHAVMSATVEEKINNEFNNAEARTACVFATDSRRSRAFRRRVAKGEAIEPLRGMFVRAPTWNSLSIDQRYRYVLCTASNEHPGAVFCYESAAFLYGICVPHNSYGTIKLATSRKKNARSTGFVNYRVVEGDEPRRVERFKVTSPLRTVFDCTRSMAFEDGLAVADSALRLRLIDEEQLDAYVRGKAGYKGVGAARKVVKYANGKAENGGESVARAAIIELGFAIPQLQKEFTDPLDGSTYRVDFLWNTEDGGLIIGELDGNQKYNDPAFMNGKDVTGVLRAERQRESRLTASGARVCRFSPSDVGNRPYFAKILEAFGVPRA